VAIATPFLLCSGMKKTFQAAGFCSLISLSIATAMLSGCAPSAGDLSAKAEAALKSGDVKAALLHAKSAVAADKNSLKARFLLFPRA
jgi:hypothetical protein